MFLEEKNAEKNKFFVRRVEKKHFEKYISL